MYYKTSAHRFISMMSRILGSRDPKIDSVPMSHTVNILSSAMFISLNGIDLEKYKDIHGKKAVCESLCIKEGCEWVCVICAVLYFFQPGELGEDFRQRLPAGKKIPHVPFHLVEGDLQQMASFTPRRFRGHCVNVTAHPR